MASGHLTIDLSAGSRAAGLGPRGRSDLLQDDPGARRAPLLEVQVVAELVTDQVLVVEDAVALAVLLDLGVVHLPRVGSAGE